MSGVLSASISGGHLNKIHQGSYASISGGYDNSVEGSYGSTVGGERILLYPNVVYAVNLGGGHAKTTLILV